jgi:uncharacterized membrane protein
MKQQHQAYIYAIIAILFWSTMGTAFKLSLGYMSPPLLLFFSSLTAFFFLGVVLLVTGKYRFLSTIGPRDVLYSALMGLFFQSCS